MQTSFTALIIAVYFMLSEIIPIMLMLRVLDTKSGADQEEDEEGPDGDGQREVAVEDDAADGLGEDPEA